jgi:DNA-binding transcriptional LysR family regulator
MTMVDWDDLRYFLAIHRTGNLARAGGVLGVNATTVSRRLAALEEQMDALLFDRTPDGYLLTPPGRDLVPRAERIEAETIALERTIAGAAQRAAGTVRVTATEMLATRFVAPHLPRFRSAWPDITLELECTNRAVSLTRREADIALRLARPREESIVTRRLAPIHLALYASPSYLERRGMPPNPEASLAGHDLLLFADSRLFKVENGWFVPRMEGASIALRSDSVSSLYTATLSGLGIALLPRAVADEDTDLARIETRTAPEPRVVWQAVHEDLQKSARIRAVLDFLAEIIPPTPT